jgi:type IV fimbrial biogenesis protein FimT
MSKQTALPLASSGFSIIEIITTLSIASVLLAIGIPSFQILTQSGRMTTAINTISTHLYLARSEAVKQGFNVVLCPSSDGLNCKDTMIWDEEIIMFADINKNGIKEAEENLLRHINITSKSIRISTTTGRRKAIYDPKGFSMGKNVTFTFCDTNNKIDPKAVIVSNTGRARLSEHESDGSPLNCS